MPKETVQYPRVDGSISTETSVRWTREDQGGHVQICVQRYPWPKNEPRTALGGAYTLPPAEGVVSAVRVVATDGLAQLEPDPGSRVVADECDLAATEPDGSVVMWTDPLGRDELNKLIRVLRRARDQAYGADA